MLAACSSAPSAAPAWTYGDVTPAPSAVAFARVIEVLKSPTCSCCHTAVIDGYAIEGHVPVAAIEDLLATRPAIDGIALPAMPPGSPGMPGVKAGPFEILAVTDGVVSPFGSY